ncbi:MULTISPECIES: hypothetical protein [Flavobacterium]|uniref:Uncharacterized protein n=1 Tax=Flavobacterium covae TaxID=2906076 RepID=A0ABW8PIV0_9FLAO|nr:MULTISPECIES: hypothetical protein [Flavobacterium]OXA73785.1 hypothetical protein B0A56_13195 [Flavobacterium columnare NBRC 100251 = ATCC 23463]AMA48822.1 hypothetical protein AWN65_04765 [Flavobacterium covae]AND65045.1 hypothetical protein AX766_11945 [Flavobacterium covae]MCJ1805517.1 hypothetical protein [Flavobacterium covae]MCJ1807938.1 hypothetical protein [Flavobacterium covae]
MVRLLTFLAFIISSVIFGQEGKYEQTMGKALAIWKEGKTMEASAIFERIAFAEKKEWLPDYYIALINCTEAFNPINKEKSTDLINKAQTALESAKNKSLKNDEINVLQALIYLVTLVQDPMNNSIKYSPLIMTEYQTALIINPNNPRAVFGKAEFELGGAKWTGVDTKPLCEEINRSLELFANFKPESPLHPKWGFERAKQVATTCK